MRRIYVALAMLAVALATVAQQPYKGEQNRPIKALSATDIDSLQQGRGMGLAKAAELNSYPGPMHVLDSKEDLKLTASQVKQAEEIMSRMRAKAKSLGQRVIDAERQLDGLFASGKAGKETVAKSVRDIAHLQGELRLCHLEAHLEMKSILTKAQIAKYDELRGYAG